MAGWQQWGGLHAASAARQAAQTEVLRKFWADMKAEAEAHSDNPADFKAQQLPLARIKKVGRAGKGAGG